MKFTTLDFPPELREQVEADMERFRTWSREGEIISAIKFDSTPYKDKSKVLHCYEVILMVDNTYFVYTQRLGDDLLAHNVSTAVLTIGTVKNIIDNSPPWTGFPCGNT